MADDLLQLVREAAGHAGDQPSENRQPPQQLDRAAGIGTPALMSQRLEPLPLDGLGGSGVALAHRPVVRIAAAAIVSAKALAMPSRSAFAGPVPTEIGAGLFVR
jgi:hypothetical protein